MRLLWGRLAQRESLKLVHDMDAIFQPLGCFSSIVHFDHILIHLVKVCIDELINDLRR